MTIKDEIIAEVQKGRAGNNQGLSMGLSKLESIIDGVCQETYTLIISNSGAGELILPFIIVILQIIKGQYR